MISKANDIPKSSCLLFFDTGKTGVRVTHDFARRSHQTLDSASRKIGTEHARRSPDEARNQLQNAKRHGVSAELQGG